MNRMGIVEGWLRAGSWILLTISTIGLLIIGFSNAITPARIIGILDCILFGIATVYLIAKWLRG